MFHLCISSAGQAPTGSGTYFGTIMKKLPLYITILIGMLVGTGLGFWAVTGGWEHLLTEWIKPWGTIFIRLLRLVAVPLVVVSLIRGITNLSDTKQLSQNLNNTQAK